MRFRVAMIGAGGIGSNLLRILAPTLSQSILSERLGGIEITIFDSDLVEQNNLHHQGYSAFDIGKYKVHALVESLSIFESSLISFKPINCDVNESTNLDRFNLVIVCVDSPHARIITHSNCLRWLDLRCRGDNFISLDYNANDGVIKSLTNLKQNPGSCQFEDAVQTGNIQFGFAAAAVFGCQWITQHFRILLGEKNALHPKIKSESITFGTLNRYL